MSHKLNQKGFGAVETLLVLILIAIIVFTGYYVWHTQKNANNTYNSAAKITQNSSAIGKPTNVEAVNRVKVAYTAYAKAASSQTKQLAAIKPYVTSSLYSKIAGASSGVNPVFCAQTAPDSFTVSLNAAASTKQQTVATVNETYSSSKVTPSVSVDLSSLKISSITCQ